MAEWICEASHIHVLPTAIHISWEALRITALLESVFSVSFTLKEDMQVQPPLARHQG